MSEEIKKVSATDIYKEHLQAIVMQELGVKVSKDKAWKLFKAIIKGTVQHVCKIDGNKISLAGIGTFKVIKSTARGKKADYPFIPRMRWSVSSTIANEVEKAFGLGDHDDITLEDYGLYKTTPVEDVAPAVEAPAAPAEEAPAAPASDLDFM